MRFLGFILPFFDRKCPYAKRCRLYQSESAPCNRDRGGYYGLGRGGGCWREMAEKEVVR